MASIQGHEKSGKKKCHLPYLQTFFRYTPVRRRLRLTGNRLMALVVMLLIVTAVPAFGQSNEARQQNPVSIHQSNTYDLLIGIAWPLAALLAVLALRKAIRTLVEKESISIQLPSGPLVHFSSKQAADTLSGLFRDFIEVYGRLLSEYQREVFRRILSYQTPPTVSAVIPGFNREKPEHLGCLRALRGIGLISPENGEKWNSDSRIVVTKFGTSLDKYLRQAF